MDLEQTKVKFAHAGNEAAVIACVLKEPTNFFEVESKMGDIDFLTPHNRALWTIIKGLMREDLATLDVSAILTQSNAMKLDDKIGGYDYVNALFDKSVDPNNIDFYIKKVIDASTKFKIIRAASQIQDLTDQNRILSSDTEITL